MNIKSIELKYFYFILLQFTTKFIVPYQLQWSSATIFIDDEYRNKLERRNLLAFRIDWDVDHCKQSIIFLGFSTSNNSSTVVYNYMQAILNYSHSIHLSNTPWKKLFVICFSFGQTLTVRITKKVAFTSSRKKLHNPLLNILPSFIRMRISNPSM